MKKPFNIATAIALLLALMNLSGCMLLDGGPYHAERGDLVGDGIRYVGWCDAHPRNVHCRDQSRAIVVARSE
jgi:hypothetical protein